MTIPADPQINTFRDILAAMEQHPELREATRGQILGDEVLRLPELVRQLQQTLAEFMAEVGGRLDRLEADVAELKAGQARLEGEVAELKAWLDRMEARQDRMERDIADLKAGQARLEARQDRMERDIAELKAGQARLEGEVAELKARLDRMEARQDRMERDIAEIRDGQREMRGMLGDVIGTNYERQVARTAGRIARRNLGMSKAAKVVHAIPWPERNFLYELADEAEVEGRITLEESDDLVLADIVVYDETMDAYALAEVSVTGEEHDVVRARRRADILAKATFGRQVRAAVVGTSFRDDCLAAAERDDVAVITQQNMSVRPPM